MLFFSVEYTEEEILNYFLVRSEIISRESAQGDYTHANLLILSSL